MKLFLVDFEITSGDKEYTVKHTIRADNIDEAEEIALFFARDFWGYAEISKPVYNEGDNFGWYGPDGDETISYRGMTEVTPWRVVKGLEIKVDAEKFRKLKDGR